MTLGWTCTIVQHDPCDTIGVPGQLVDIVVTDDGSVVLSLANEPSLCNFIALITDKEAERFDDGL